MLPLPLGVPQSDGVPATPRIPTIAITSDAAPPPLMVRPVPFRMLTSVRSVSLSTTPVTSPVPSPRPSHVKSDRPRPSSFLLVPEVRPASPLSLVRQVVT